MDRTFQPVTYYNTFGPHEPAFRIESGDTLHTKTLCAQGIDEHDVQVADRGNPLSGPVFVKGAEPGDTLQVDVLSARPNRPEGWTRTVVASHVVNPGYVKELPEDEYARWRMNEADNTASLLEPATALGQSTLPLDPMLGCLGVAPARHQAISTATSAEHGGNMDYRAIRAGATLYFPVFEPGALLFTGDGHAVQGDGEIVGTGIEISMDVSLRVTLIKGKEIGWPRGEDAQWIFALGNARPLDQALQLATTEMIHWLTTDYGLDPRAASILLGQCVRYDIGNVFDPAYTVACKVAKDVLP